ncbi:hypothetical protein JCM33374_g200 [Metschnikowia sp. JCM 33374]|nr:hypothetical protein JCM33374_g200 [Metschnikowia sp. JCM 33374]
MPHALFEYSLERLDNLEGIEVALPRFDSAVAWIIGLHAYELSQTYEKPILIDITLPNGQVLFHSPSKNGAVLDNDFWINRKKKTTLRFGKSSFYMGRKVAIKKMSVEAALFVDPKEYATHGGSVPIRILGSDFVCGALTVSGLAQEDDHLFALQVLKDIKARLESKV